MFAALQGVSAVHPEYGLGWLIEYGSAIALTSVAVWWGWDLSAALSDKAKPWVFAGLAGLAMALGITAFNLYFNGGIFAKFTVHETPEGTLSVTIPKTAFVNKAELRLHFNADGTNKIIFQENVLHGGVYPTSIDITHPSLNPNDVGADHFHQISILVIFSRPVFIQSPDNQIVVQNSNPNAPELKLRDYGVYWAYFSALSGEPEGDVDVFVRGTPVDTLTDKGTLPSP